MDSLFSIYNVEEDDTIDVDVSVENLLKTLRSINSLQVKIHLKTSRSKACHFRLTSMQKFETDYFPVSHEIPVQITHRHDFVEPSCEDMVMLAVSDIIQPLLKLSERYRFLDTLITVKGNRNGVFRIYTESELGNVTSTFKGVNKIMLNSETTENMTYERSEEYSCVTVRAKDWWNMLQINHIAKKIVVCIRDQEMLNVYCFLNPQMNGDDGTFSYYIKHVSED